MLINFQRDSFPIAGSKIGTVEPAVILRSTLHSREEEKNPKNKKTNPNKNTGPVANNYIKGQCMNKYAMFSTRKDTLLQPALAGFGQGEE